MGNRCRQKSFTSIMLYTGLSLFVMCGAALAGPQYTLTCSSCHSMPPLDTSTDTPVEQRRNPDTGAFLGNHQKHVQGTTSDSCLPCHDSSAYGMTHRDGSITLQANINTSPYPVSGGQYKIGTNVVTFKNQTSLPTMGNCSNVNCHFERTSPDWGTPALGARSEIVCSTCHDAVPTTNAHAKHTAFYATKNSVPAADTCNGCHITNYTDATHALEVGRAIRVTLATGKYSTAMKASYLPSQQAARVEGDCSNLYCHSDGKGNYVKPNWATPSSGACGTCHTTAGIATGSHTKHLTTANATAYGCDSCHTGAANNGSTYVSANHVNNAIDHVDCSTAYCHSDGSRAAAPFVVKVTPTWGTPFTATCASCHGDATAGATQIASGKHTKHLAAGYGCATCHTATVSSNTVIGTAANHVDQKINVNISATYGGTYSANQHAPGAASGSCSTTYCHSNGQATPTYVTQAWSGTLDCTGCHGNGTIGLALSDAHPKHVGSFGCVICHGATVSNNTTISTPANHLNAGREVSMTGVAAGGSYVSDTKTCSVSACHSSGTPQWNVASSGACGTCHAVTKTGLTTGSHQKHINTVTAVAPYSCDKCHAGVVYDGTTATSYSSANHINQANDFTSCSAQYCHSDGTRAAAPFVVKVAQDVNTWRTPVAITCASCHGDATSGATQIATGKHTVHLASGIVGIGCATCHSATVDTNTHISTVANHVDQKINVNINANYGGTYSANLHAPGAASGSCSTTYCHSNGQASPTYTTPAWTAAALDCQGCHTTAGLSAAHGAHLTAGRTCIECHSETVSSNTALLGGTVKHINKSRDVKMAGVSSYTTGNCTTSCHLTATPNWTTPSSGACGTCHGIASATLTSNAHEIHIATTGHGPKTSCATCHTNSGSGATHVNSAVNLNAGINLTGTCGTCHTVTESWSAAATTVTCQDCHTGSGSTIGVAAPLKSLAATVGHGAQGQDCTVCHDSNSDHISGTLGDNNRLKTALGTGNANCLYCHNTTGTVTNPAMLNMAAHRTSGLGSQCADCHDAHGTSNTMMVNSTINSTAVSFSGNNTFANGANNGVCQVCHTTTTYFKANGTGAAHVDSTENCLRCHSHNPAGTGNLAFMPNGGCDACHGYPPIPRNVNLAGIVEFKLGSYSSARFEDYSGGGGAHIVAAHLSPNVRQSQGFAPCVVCHQDAEASHIKAMPISTNIANVSVKIDPKHRLRNNIFPVYTSAKFATGGANKTGKCFNVDCHFKTTEKWSTEK